MKIYTYDVVKEFCVLGKSYFNDVLETASIGAVIPYHGNQQRVGYYWKKFRKQQGIIVTGFRMDWTGKPDPESPFAWFDMPISDLFIPENLIDAIKGNESGWLIRVHESGTVKENVKYSIRARKRFVQIVAEVVRPMTKTEIATLKAINDFVGGTV